jgi:molybdenum cofactor guanylyltransferase
MTRFGSLAAGILLAGGRSTRMGIDKRLLDIRGRPLIVYVLDQLKKSFDEVIVSADHLPFDVPGVHVVGDEAPNQSPLMGIRSALNVSHNAINFVQVCDIPDTSWDLVAQMLEKAREGFDVVMPRDKEGRLDPLFAVYHRRTVPIISEILVDHHGAARVIAEKCSAHIIDVEHAPFSNLNQIEDFISYLKKKWPVDPGNPGLI